jgi:hypothetical protein
VTVARALQGGGVSCLTWVGSVVVGREPPSPEPQETSAFGRWTRFLLTWSQFRFHRLGFITDDSSSCETHPHRPRRIELKASEASYTALRACFAAYSLGK